jgi:putative transposase
MGANIDECTQTVRVQKWTEILRDRQSSGQSNAAYCAEHGINIKTFYYWQTKLRRQAAGMLNVSSSCEMFAPVESHPIVPVNFSGSTAPEITVRKGGFTVELSHDTSPAVLETLLTVLSKVC